MGHPDQRRDGVDLAELQSREVDGHRRQDGSLKPGKMADVVLWNGNPFSVYTRPERVWIDGAQMYDANDPRTRPVSDFELGQPGEGDVTVRTVRSEAP
jgi:hypothetical protein